MKRYLENIGNAREKVGRKVVVVGCLEVWLKCGLFSPTNTIIFLPKAQHLGFPGLSRYLKRSFVGTLNHHCIVLLQQGVEVMIEGVDNMISHY